MGIAAAVGAGVATAVGGIGGAIAGAAAAGIVGVGLSAAIGPGGLTGAILGGGGGGASQQFATGGSAPGAATASGSNTSTGTGPFQGLSQYQSAGVRLSTSPEGKSEEAPVNNPMMPLENKAPAPAHAATKWSLGSTPSQAPYEQQSQQEAGNIWADRLSRYLDYNTRQLG